MNPEEAKLRNIIDMALGFTVMARVFEKGTFPKIREKLWEILQSLAAIETDKDFERMHRSF